MNLFLMSDPMTTKKTAEERANIRFLDPLIAQHGDEEWAEAHSSDMRFGFATCIREEVEPLEATNASLTEENAKLRAFIDKFIPSECWGVDAFDGGEVQDVAVEMGILVKVDHTQPCKVEECNCEGSDYLYYTAWTAKEQGFVPTNTTEP